jgi:hypothetical protein
MCDGQGQGQRAAVVVGPHVNESDNDEGYEMEEILQWLHGMWVLVVAHPGECEEKHASSEEELFGSATACTPLSRKKRRERRRGGDHQRLSNSGSGGKSTKQSVN